jgi:hypothetical protein
MVERLQDLNLAVMLLLILVLAAAVEIIQMAVMVDLE